jgi:transglutaminase-like putative cysteine protease
VSVVTSLAIRIGCEFVFENETSSSTPAVFLVRPDERVTRIRAEHWSADPATPYHDYRDVYGNTCRRLNLPPGFTTLRYDTVADVPPSPAETDWSAQEILVAELPDETLLYTLPSRLCPSDEISDRAWELFGGVTPGWTRVQAICDWVHGYLKFSYGTSLPHTTAADVLEAGTGVCRDFAQLAVTFCRALNIPARYAFGYMPDIGVPPTDAVMDFCAWFEAYLGGRWWTFDPRNNQRRIGHIPIARGRDAIDTAMVTTYGSARLDKMTVWADQTE